MHFNDHTPPHFHAEYGGNEELYMKLRRCAFMRANFLVELIISLLNGRTSIVMN